MITYLVEPWSQVKQEIVNLIDKHWEEVAVYRDQITLKIQWDAYDAMEKQGMLHCVALRNEGALIGYYIGIVKPHLHYADSLTCFTDVYFIDKAHRKGRAGIELFKIVEKTLHKRGVQRMIVSTKITLDMSPILQRLGFDETERVYMKLVS